MKKNLARILCLVFVMTVLLGAALTFNVSAQDTGTKYTFSDYTAGTQYAGNEEHVLDENVTITTTDCHFTTQLRIYSSTTNNGFAVIKSEKPITSIVLNAGNKTDTLNVYTSTDGSTWTLAQGVTITSTSYKDYTVSFTEATKYIKLDVAGANQVRVAYMTLTFHEHAYAWNENVGADGSHTLTCANTDGKCDALTITKECTWIDGSCSVCGATAPDCAHTNTTEVPKVPANCTEPGYKAGVQCTECNAYTSGHEEIPALGHTEVIDEAVDATCTETGLTEGKHCSVCNTVLTAQETIPVTEHTYINGFCSVCSAEQPIEYTIDFTNKEYSNAADVTEVEQDGIILVFSKGSGSNAPKYYTSGTAVRIYSNNTLTITAPEGYIITGIEFTYHTAFDLSVNNGALGTNDSANKTCSWTQSPEKVSELVFTVKSNSRIQKMTVSLIACSHANTEVIPAVDATCTTTGLTAGTKCSDCGAVVTEQTVTETISHTPEVIPAVDATCTTTGLTEGEKCSVCGEISVAQEETPVIDHNYVNGACDVCGAPEVCSHELGELIPETAAGCFTDGEKAHYFCSLCQRNIDADKETVLDDIIIPAYGSHDIITVEKLDPTDDVDGHEAGEKCSRCDYYTTATPIWSQKTIVEKLYALGNGEVLENIDGSTEFTLTGVIVSVDEAYNSQYSNITVTIRVNGADENQTIKCYRLKGTGADKISEGDTITVTGTLKNYNNGTFEFDSGCTFTHECEYSADCDTTCNICGKTREIADDIAHGNVVTDEAKAPTCTETGLTEGSHCSVCDTVIVAQETVAALGHSYESVVTTPASCTEEGVMTYTCKTCNDTYTEAIPFAHNWGEWLEDAPTCTTDGYRIRECNDCDAEDEETISALGHSWGEWIEITAATCTETGEQMRECSECGELDEGVIEALGHNFVDGVCTRCDEKELTYAGEYYIAFIRKGEIYYLQNSLNGTRYAVTTTAADKAVFTIEKISEGIYTISVIDSEGTKKYMTWNSGNSGAYTDTVDSALSLSIVKNENGTYEISHNNDSAVRYLALNGTTYDYSAWYKSGQIQDVILIPKDHKYIESANVKAGADLTLKYHVAIPEGFDADKFTMTFTFNGEVYEGVTGTLTEGKYVFAFTGITPQAIGDSIKAELIYTDNEVATIIQTIESYSVKENLVSLLKQYSDSTADKDIALVTLVSDILMYGQAAQKYAEYKTDALIVDGDAELKAIIKPSEEAPVSTVTPVLIGDGDENIGFTASGVKFDYVNKAYVRLQVSEGFDTSNVTVTIQVGNGAEKSVAFSDFAKNGNVYTVYTDALTALEFDEEIIFTLMNGDTVIETLSYSVNAYTVAKQNSQNAELAELVKALYRYGNSALDYNTL